MSGERKKLALFLCKVCGSESVLGYQKAVTQLTALLSVVFAFQHFN